IRDRNVTGVQTCALPILAMQPVLEARNIIKSFGQVQALKGANFQIDLGEIVALIGDNGAGKSTLVKILSGALQPDSGEILIKGRSEERRVGKESRSGEAR